MSGTKGKEVGNLENILGTQKLAPVGKSKEHIHERCAGGQCVRGRENGEKCVRGEAEEARPHSAFWNK